MNYKENTRVYQTSDNQIAQFQGLITKLFQCCQERMQYQCERFGLPDAELRCLKLFGEERYLTAKGIAFKMNLVKSRITKIVSGLVEKNLIQKIDDPKDSRVTLLSLTQQGVNKLNEINKFVDEIHSEVLLRIEPEQRKTLITNLELLKGSMESVKELMV